MSEYPNLAGIATDNLIEKIGSNKFQASYINWSRTMHLLRTHAPGWLPELVHNAEGGILHRAPIGAYLLIRFVHADGRVTPAVPQAIMNNSNNSIALSDVTSRDVTDTQVRGICKAAALLFGLAYELWAKMPLESGYAEQVKPDEAPAKNDGELTAEEVRKIKHDEAVAVWGESVEAIKASVAKDDAYSVRELWDEIDDGAKRALWIAPSKGGCFSTAERDYIKNKMPAKQSEEA